MEESAFLGGVVAGLVYLIAGVRLGACDPLVCNRFSIWGLTGVVWTVYQFVFLVQTVECEASGVWSSTMDRANGAVEATGVALVWLIYFPPRFYRRWIASAALSAQPEEV